jgi:hypothetical protein
MGLVMEDVFLRQRLDTPLPFDVSFMITQALLSTDQRVQKPDIFTKLTYHRKTLTDIKIIGTGTASGQVIYHESYHFNSNVCRTD